MGVKRNIIDVIITMVTAISQITEFNKTLQKVTVTVVFFLKQHFVFMSFITHYPTDIIVCYRLLLLFLSSSITVCVCYDPYMVMSSV